MKQNYICLFSELDINVTSGWQEEARSIGFSVTVTLCHVNFFYSFYLFHTLHDIVYLIQNACHTATFEAQQQSIQVSENMVLVERKSTHYLLASQNSKYKGSKIKDKRNNWKATSKT